MMNASLPAFTDQAIIRPMLLHDIGQVHSIDHASFSIPWSERAYRYEILQNEHSSLWVAETGFLESPTKIVGMIVTWFILDEVHIATLAVHPDYRRIGIAKRLLTTALKDALNNGCVNATLEVRANNLPAQILYQQFGFKIVGHRPHYYRDNNEDALIMSFNELSDKFIRQLENKTSLSQIFIPNG